MIDQAFTMAPSTVPPSATLDDFVYPRELLTLTAGSWYGSNFFENLTPGQSFTLYLPIRRGTETTEYQFTFEVRDAATTPQGSTR
jgi:hypothetical protein